MFKLLSKQDRRAAKNETLGDTHVVMTAGIGFYSCVNCRHYNTASPEAPSGQACLERSVPPDAMPCTFSPRQPGVYFSLREDVAGKEKIDAVLNRMDLQSMLVLHSLLPKAIEKLVEKEALGLPYRVGDTVMLIHNQFLVEAKIVEFDQKVVHLILGNERLQVPHAQVMVPKTRKTDVIVENLRDPSTSGVDLKQTPPLPEP